MKKLTTFAQKLWNDESGQGTAEYILLLVIVVGVAMLFKGEIMGAVREKLDSLKAGMASITTN